MGNKEFIPYQQALQLKELGFDEPCFGVYINNKLTIEDEWFYATNQETFIESDNFTAPLFSQAFRWFREKHKLFSVVNVKYVNGAFYFLRIETPPTNGYQYFDEGFKTYEEAELACLIKLIEIVKGGNNE